VRGNAHLPQVAQTLNAFRRRFGIAQRGQKHCRKNGNNGDHYQQFDQCETAIPGSASS
jgi:hypothetical protein